MLTKILKDAEAMPNYEFYNLLQELDENLVDKFNRVDPSLRKQLKAVIVRKVALMRKYGVTGEAITIQYIISDAINGVIIDPDNDRQEIQWTSLSLES